MKFSYLIGEGFKNVFKNKKSAVTSLVTMICAMFLFGIFFAIGENINYVLEQVQRSQGMEVFILNEATQEQIDELGNKIKDLDGINTVKFKTKEQALDSMKESMKEYKDLEFLYLLNYCFHYTFPLIFQHQLQSQLQE